MYLSFVSVLFKVLLLWVFGTQMRRKHSVSCCITRASMLSTSAVLSYCTSAAICFLSVLITQDSHNSLWRHITTQKHRLPVEIITPAVTLSSPGSRPEARSVFLSVKSHFLFLKLSQPSEEWVKPGKYVEKSMIFYLHLWVITRNAWNDVKKTACAVQGCVCTIVALIWECCCMLDGGCKHSLG